MEAQNGQIPTDVVPVKVALWSVPRSTSTIFTKCLCGVRDISVFSELYSMAACCKILFEGTTGKELPVELEGNESIYDESYALWKEVTGLHVPPRRMSYSEIRDEIKDKRNRFIFMKEMTTYAVDSFWSNLPEGLKHTFIIRDPTRVFSSYRRAVMSKYSESIPAEFDIARDDILQNDPLTWFAGIHKLWRHVVDHIDPNPVIIDSYDLLSRPGPTLKAYCEAVGYPYTDGLLQWEASLELPGNMTIAGPDVYKDMKAFYGTAFNSTHFMAPQGTRSIPRDELTDDVIKCSDQSMPFYLEMYEHRLQI